MAATTHPVHAHPSDSAEPRCSCGHDRHHYMVTPSAVHGLGGWLRVFIGISTRPKEIRYQCRRCDEVIEKTTDAEELDRYY
ncbi:MAG: hypothetical protein ACXWUG_07520 [Polyangiales bacterium]